MKKLFASLTALSCVGSMLTAFPAKAEDSIRTFIVTAVSNPENPSSYILTATDGYNAGYTYYVSSSNVAEYAEQEYFEVGDIIEFRNLGYIATEMDATNQMGIGEANSAHEDSAIVKVGSIIENPEMQEFTFFGYSYSTYLKNDTDSYFIYLDWDKGYYYQPDMIDYDSLTSGDVVSCYTYEGRPYIISSTVQGNVFNEYLVLDNNGENYTLMSEYGQTYYVDTAWVNGYLYSDFTPEFADVLRFRNLDVISDVMLDDPATLYADLERIPDVPNSPVIVKSDYIPASPRTDSVKFDIVDTAHNLITLSDGEQNYSFFTDWLDLYQENPDFLTEEEILNQQSLHCLTWNGRPFIAVSDESRDFIQYAYVVGVDNAENPQQVVLISNPNASSYYDIVTFPVERLTPYMTDTQIHLGDVLQFQNIKITHYRDIDFAPDTKETPEDRPFNITVTGTLYDYPTKEFTVYRKNSTINFDVLDDNRNKYNMDLPSSKFESISPTGRIKEGDTVTCIVDENERPIILYNKPEQVETTPNGDADGNGKLDILDVITVNRAILGKDKLATERIPYVDFNGNGIPDSDDSLTMMRMIVGLV